MEDGRFYSSVKLEREDYKDFEKKEFPCSLNFYDFEVFKEDWCLTIINPVDLLKVTITNDTGKLRRYYSSHKDEVWVGYNSRNYDVFILKAILLGMNPKSVNDDIIIRGKKGWEISDEFRKIQLYNFDLFQVHSLKTLEGFMGNSIEETGVDFNIDRKLTPAEMRETVKYNVHDVEQTIEVFRRKRELYDSQIMLIETFEMPFSLIDCTQAQLTAKILQCSWKAHYDEFDFKIVKNVKLRKYARAKEWFENPVNMDYRKSFSMDVCGVPHQFGWGGLHGSPDKPLRVKGDLWHVDVNSYYPSEIIEYGFMSRNSASPERYEEIYKYRLKLKAEGKKKEQAPYKIVLNATFGMMKDKYSSAYDPVQANNIVVNGQLMLLSLLERLEEYIILIQSNTDGLIVQLKDGVLVEKFKRVCARWERLTGMTLAFDEMSEIIQKDVNNYIAVFKNGKLERKGGYVKELSELDYDLPIVNEALVRYMIDGKLIEDTIAECDVMKMFQKVVKVSSAYKGAWHNGEGLPGKTFRLFASTDDRDSFFGKWKVSGNIEKFANTPEHCFILNGNVNGIPMSEKLDKSWYVNLAKSRLRDFGLGYEMGGLL